jgi:hypothetical protein
LEAIAAITVLGFLAVLGLITGLLAKRKGYNFAPWFLAGGTFELIVLAFYPLLMHRHFRSSHSGIKPTKGIASVAL